MTAMPSFRRLPRWFAVACLAGSGLIPTTAQPLVEFVPLDVAIPDGDPFGMSDTVTISGVGPAFRVGEVAVSLDIEGGFNGDLYAQLTHESGFVVLLNRTGRQSGGDHPFGYADAGFQITLADTAPADVHQYRLTLSGNHDTPLGGPLTGAWQPDGRAVDPANVGAYDSRTALFDSFKDLNPNGDWTLYLLDAEAGNEAILKSWTLEVTLVPEPAEAALALGLGLLGVAGLARVRRAATFLEQAEMQGRP
ncbi:MAG: PEP-CTERM sorting domain-containing protein [Verrucomicrobiales bacterium]|nr:PEP-CTERM sorting domain-containing protein [Verrucomicrobiales bacterium]